MLYFISVFFCFLDKHKITDREADYRIVIDKMVQINENTAANFGKINELYRNKYKVLAVTGKSVVKSNCIFFSTLK